MKLARSVAVLAVLLAACRASTSPGPVTLPVLAYNERAPGFPVGYRWSSATDPYLTQLYERYSLDEVMEGAKSDLDHVKAASRWVHTQFAHNSTNASRSADPMGILAEAATGKRFRSAEYATVTVGVLTSLGIPSRSVWLFTSTEATRTDGVAHVVAEAYLRDLNKWVMVDAQWDAISFADDKPLSALELQKAIAAKKPGLTVASRSGTSTGSYVRWIAPYLYYFYSRVDNRVGVNRTVNAVLLTPIGDTSLSTKYPAPIHRLTHSVAEFYPAIK